jgi:hypothetical protein
MPKDIQLARRIRGDQRGESLSCVSEEFQKKISKIKNK